MAEHLIEGLKIDFTKPSGHEVAETAVKLRIYELKKRANSLRWTMLGNFSIFGTIVPFGLLSFDYKSPSLISAGLLMVGIANGAFGIAVLKQHDQHTQELNALTSALASHYLNSY